MGDVAPMSPQTARFAEQVKERFMEKQAAPEQKERAEEVVHKTFEGAAGAPLRAADSDVIEKMKAQLAAEGAKTDAQIKQEAATQGILKQVGPLLGGSKGGAAPAA